MKSQRFQLLTRGAGETREVGRTIGTELISGDLLAFTGDLGSGKTCMIQGISQGLEVPDESYVRSPTFIIMNMYQGRLPLYHMDLYRMQDSAELEDIGYREIFFGEGVTVIEWADKVERFLPEGYLHVHLKFLDETRREMVVEARGERFGERVEAWGRLLGGGGGGRPFG